MNSNTVRLLCFCILFGLCGCLAQDEMVDFPAGQLSRLLASDSAKSWQLTNRLVDDQSVIQDCEQDDILVFQTSNMLLDTAMVAFLTGPILCPGQSDSIMFEGSWEVIDTTNAQAVRLVIDGDTSLLSIDFITSQILRSSYIQAGKFIREEFISVP